MLNTIAVRGARAHNLKNVDLDIPKNKLVVFTGVSGSGKSSMAFDTIYAEGQRRYVESLSSYARQFLGIMEKPDVDLIEGLSPAISIDQKTATHNPRSTVGTVTEIYDYLRLLFARVGHPHCPQCGREVRKMSAQEVVTSVLSRIEETVGADKNKPHRFFILSPVVRSRKGEFKELFDNLRAKGYTHTRIDGYFHSLEEDLYILKNNKHTIDIVIDRLSADYASLRDEKKKSEFSSRLFKAVESALALSDGLAILAAVHDAGFSMPEAPQQLTEELYSEHFSCPVCSIALAEVEPRLFSFNSPVGACSRCKGLGSILRVDRELVANPELSIAEGAIFPFQKIFFIDTWLSRLFKTVLKTYHIDSNVPLKTLSKEQREILFNGTARLFAVRGRNREGALTTIHENWRGVVGELEKKYYEADSETVRGDVSKYMREEICPVCRGTRLNKEALSVTVRGESISTVCGWSIQEELLFFNTVLNTFSENEQRVAEPILKEITTRLAFLDRVGLSYLTLGRRANTLSGGEAQRIRLASQIGTGLTGITYVLDEPSIGLHARDVSQLLSALQKLRDLGNSVIVVEHDWETIQSADWIFDFGPYAGKNGGTIVYSGERKGIVHIPHSLTGQFLSGKRDISTERESAPIQHFLTVSGAHAHNLKNITTTIPLERMIGITGVSGSGKSTFLLDTLYPLLEQNINPYYKGAVPLVDAVSGMSEVQRVVLVDQSPIGRTPRSNPATYTGVFTHIRECFAQTTSAKARGYRQGRFSFNVKGGRCEHCQGGGLIKVEMQFLADVYITCDVCKGKRYNNETLEVLYKEKTIDDVLKMTVDEAAEFFSNHYKISRILSIMREVGLGYLELGQPAPTLSGGEAQRVKLAKELYTNVSVHTVYMLDEPTTGLHMYDVEKLIRVLRNLVKQGNTVMVIEHNFDVIKNCDYIVDLGPEGGDGGGAVVFQGSVEELLSRSRSHTAQFLKKYIEKK